MKLWQDLTDMLNHSLIYSEMEKKYKNTWLELQTDSTREMVRFTGNNPDGQFVFRDVYDNPIIVNKDTQHKLIVPVIPQGLYQCNKIMFHGRYTAARQYRRGISSDSFCVCEPLTATTLSLPLFLKYYLLQEYNNSIKIAMDLLITDNRTSQVVNRNFGIVNTQDVPVFMYQDIVIGKFIGKEIHIINDEFYQEVLDSQRTIDFSGYEVKYV